jgi:hypothetical protein
VIPLRLIQSPPITQRFLGRTARGDGHLPSQSGQEWTDFEGVRDAPGILVRKSKIYPLSDRLMRSRNRAEVPPGTLDNGGYRYI